MVLKAILLPLNYIYRVYPLGKYNYDSSRWWYWNKSAACNFKVLSLPGSMYILSGAQTRGGGKATAARAICDAWKDFLCLPLQFRHKSICSIVILWLVLLKIRAEVTIRIYNNKYARGESEEETPGTTTTSEGPMNLLVVHHHQHHWLGFIGKKLVGCTQSFTFSSHCTNFLLIHKQTGVPGGCTGWCCWAPAACLEDVEEEEWWRRRRQWQKTVMVRCAAGDAGCWRWGRASIMIITGKREEVVDWLVWSLGTRATEEQHLKAYDIIDLHDEDWV